MTTIFADIFSTVAEIEFECHEREMSDEKTAAAIEYALTHIG